MGFAAYGCVILFPRFLVVLRDYRGHRCEFGSNLSNFDDAASISILPLEIRQLLYFLARARLILSFSRNASRGSRRFSDKPARNWRAHFPNPNPPYPRAPRRYAKRKDIAASPLSRRRGGGSRSASGGGWFPAMRKIRRYHRVAQPARPRPHPAARPSPSPTLRRRAR